MSAATPSHTTPARHRPKSLTVFAAAFIAGAAAAVGVNRVLDVQLAQRRPQVECEPIFVALRSLPQGSPVTVWDVALKDWPKAMLPGSALRASDSFEGFVLRHAIREGQPLLAVQLVRTDALGGSPGSSVAAESFTAPVPAAAPIPAARSSQTDLWTPAETVAVAKPAVAAARPQVTAAPNPAAVPLTVAASAPSEPTPADPVVAEQPDEQPARHGSDVAAGPAPLPQGTEPAASTAARSPMPPSPTDIEPPSRISRPTPAFAEDDAAIAEATVTDVASMPSVMAPAPGTSQPATTSSKGDAGRYLVVPERIALQADTSFTTPRPQPPGPPTGPSRRTAQTQAPRSAAPAPQRPRQTAPTTAQGSGRREQAPPQQPAKQQAAPRGRQAPQAAAQRPWGGMFPTMAAGIEAMGSVWQKPRAGVASGQPQSGPGQQSSRR
jgi:hypothetical protein